MAEIINTGAPTSVLEYPIGWLRRKQPVQVVNLEKGKDFEIVDSSPDPDQNPADELGTDELPSTSE